MYLLSQVSAGLPINLIFFSTRILKSSWHLLKIAAYELHKKKLTPTAGCCLIIWYLVLFHTSARHSPLCALICACQDLAATIQVGLSPFLFLIVMNMARSQLRLKVIIAALVCLDNNGVLQADFTWWLSIPMQIRLGLIKKIKIQLGTPSLQNIARIF